MTKPHPLTDAMLYEMFLEESGMGFTDGSMRAAYDKGAADKLEQVIEWLTENLYYIQEDGLVRYVYGDDFATIATHEVVRDLKQAMRPAKQEDNND